MRIGRKPSSFVRPWTRQPRIILIGLIGLNVAAFVAQLFVESWQAGFTSEFLGLSETGLQDAYAWQFFTAMFMHLGPLHLIANVGVLYLLGRDVESILGQRHFLYLYLAGAFAGEAAHLLFLPAASVLYGSSGGVMAVLMAYVTILPELELDALVVFVPLRVKAKYLGYAAAIVGLVALLIGRHGNVLQSALLGGSVAGLVYAHLLGFGRPSFVQRALHQRKLKAERFRLMDADEFVAEEVDPILEKIARSGLQSLTRRERRTLTLAREKLSSKA